jgi:hypothetical protein
LDVVAKDARGSGRCDGTIIAVAYVYLSHTFGAFHG